MGIATGLVVFYDHQHKSGINALLGAVESHPELDDMPVALVEEVDRLTGELENALFHSERVVLALSFFTSQASATYRMVRNVKDLFGDRIVAVGGGAHPSGAPSEAVRSGFDAVVTGEGEEALPELLLAIAHNDRLDRVKGLYLRSSDEPVYTGTRPRVDLDDFRPFPERHRKAGPIEITRGCPYGCAFCQTSRIFGGQVRHRSEEAVIAGIATMKARGLNDMRFITPNAFSYGSVDGRRTNLPALEGLLWGMRNVLGDDGRIFFGSFPSEVRPEHVTEETIGLVKRYCDNDNLVIGAQSGSERILEHCRRGHSVADVYEAVRLTAENGLVPNVDFIFGLPGETEEDTAVTLRVIEDLVALGARIHAHAFMPLPGTPYAAKQGAAIREEVWRFIDRLARKGQAFGQFRKQEQKGTLLY
ncbi:MAG: TIGR04013 family B12-binding domain/radical SAM domain-containing protein [Candidatus Aquicultorales bacterium]